VSEFDEPKPADSTPAAPAAPPPAAHGQGILTRPVFLGYSLPWLAGIFLALGATAFYLFWPASTSTDAGQRAFGQDAGLMAVQTPAAAPTVPQTGGLSVPATVSAAGAGNILLILAAVLFFDIAIQALNVLNQTRLMALNPDNRSRINTAFVTCNFIGGAVGSALAGTLWQTGGWVLLMATAIVLLSASFCVWFFQRHRL